MISLWNSLSEDVVMILSLEAFEKGFGEISVLKVHEVLQSMNE